MQLGKSNIIKCIYIIHALILATALATPAMANTAENTKNAPYCTVMLGAAAAAIPEFEGSHKHNIRFVPLFDINIKNRFFLSTDKGLGLNIISTPEWELSTAVNYGVGRKEKASTLLKGMGNISDGAVFAAHGAWTPGPFILNLDAKYGTGDIQGLNLTAGLAYVTMPVAGVQWVNEVSTTFADSKYNNTFFGISKKQSQKSRHNYKYYNAKSGIKDVALKSMLIYGLTEHVIVVLAGEYKQLVGPAADSPLVKAGAKSQISGITEIGYIF
ncbi:MipA/OmpV family protein [Desulfovibrio sp. OttesenSCG-928-F07]|nr:MipA/OmpV family protein [Desulfovibrio sp. OttesenSCG-928-F07]